MHLNIQIIAYTYMYRVHAIARAREWAGVRVLPTRRRRRRRDRDSTQAMQRWAKATNPWYGSFPRVYISMQVTPNAL